VEELSLDEATQRVAVERMVTTVEAPSAGTLYLSPPLTAAQRAIRSALRSLDAGYEELRLGTIVVRVTAGDLESIGAALASSLSASELAATHSLILQHRAPPPQPPQFG
jgi:hypothetical protein